MRYVDQDGRIYEARKGLGDYSFMTMRHGGVRGGWHRVKSTYLPVRATLAEAQADLDEWAKDKHLRPFGGEC